MLKRFVFMIVAAACAATVSAQPAKQAPAKEPSKSEAPPAAKPAPEPMGMPINVKIEVSITDQTGTNAPAKKVVTMLTTDRQSNSIRSSASVAVKVGAPTATPPQYIYRNVTINVDARPTIVAKEPNKVLIAFGLEYLPKSAGGAEELEPGMSQLNERLSLVLESGKPMIVSQAADPVSDRKITVEVTATILK
jgi:hypothetical protein